MRQRQACGQRPQALRSDGLGRDRRPPGWPVIGTDRLARASSRAPTGPRPVRRGPVEAVARGCRWRATPPAAHEASAVLRPLARAPPALAPQAARTRSSSRCTRCTGHEGSSALGRRGFPCAASAHRKGRQGWPSAHGSGEPRHPPSLDGAPEQVQVLVQMQVQVRLPACARDALNLFRRTAWPLPPTRARARRWPPTRCTAYGSVHA